MDGDDRTHPFRPAGAGFDYFIRPLLDAHGVSYDELTAVHGGQAQADKEAASAYTGKRIVRRITQGYSEDAAAKKLQHFLGKSRHLPPALCRRH